MSPGIVLSIESAIVGGSISVLRDNVEVGSWIGDASNLLKAEDLLFNIDRLLERVSIDLNELDLIVVSAGPGSFTGIRIGIATALGLKTGLGIEMASESALKAIVHEHDGTTQDLFAALPVGRDSVCVQRFDHADAIDEPRTLSERDFVDFISEQQGAAFLIHEKLFKTVPDSKHIRNAGANVARSVGLLCSINRNVVIEPLFIAKSF